jgi:DNA-binding NtrC family response regulator
MNPKIKLLVIDDEKGLRDMVAFALPQEDYVVYTASTGAEGIQKVTENDIDIVLTDIKMPEMDGIVVLKKIKEINPAIEVIVVTGYSTMGTVEEALRNGAFDYLPKPYNLDELFTMLKKAYCAKQTKH